MSERLIPDCGLVTNARVYDLDESIKASGYPMKVAIPSLNNPENLVINEKDQKRTAALIKAVDNDNQAHGQFLSGILVSFDLTFSNKAWVEAERYRFLTFVSSQSTMHKIAKFDIKENCIGNVDPRILEIVNEKVAAYNEENTPEKYLDILYNVPAGFKITARMTTNYRCLRNIYKQRKNHRLPEWREFCKWIETLPMANELLIN